MFPRLNIVGFHGGKFGLWKKHFLQNKMPVVEHNNNIHAVCRNSLLALK